MCSENKRLCFYDKNVLKNKDDVFMINKNVLKKKDYVFMLKICVEKLCFYDKIRVKKHKES